MSYNGMKLHVVLLTMLLFPLFNAPHVYSATPTIEYLQSIDVVYPGKMAQDQSGQIYVVDQRKSTVHVFDKYGNSIKIISSIIQPVAVATGSRGEVYIASASGVYNLASNGDISLFIPGNEVSSPLDMAVDAAGYVYVVESTSRSVKVFSSSGIYLSSFGNSVDFLIDSNVDGISDGCSSCYPLSIDIMFDEIEKIEKILVGYSVEQVGADNNNMMLVTFDISGTPLAYLGSPFRPTAMDAVPLVSEITKVNGIATDKSGRIYVSDTSASRVTVWAGDGSVITSLNVDNVPNSVMTDSYGRLFVSTMNGRVDIYSIDGQNVPNAIPTAPSFITPAGGDLVKTKTPTLIASNGSDANDAVLTYEFEIATDLSMSNIVWHSGPVAEGDNGMTSVIVDSPLQEDTLYYWRIRVYDGKDYSPYSQVTSFRVNSENAPPQLDSISPTAVSLKVDVGSSIGFSIAGHDPDSNRGLLYKWFVDGELVSYGKNVFEFVAGTQDVGLHSVEVQLSDSVLTMSHQWNVTVYRRNTAPLAPTPYLPSGGEDVNVYNPRLTVQNAPRDAEGDSVVYNFEVSTVSNFSNIVTSITGISEGDQFTSAEIPVQLQENTLYYWRVKSCEVPMKGTFVKEYYCSSPSETESFFVNVVNDRSGRPGISSPSDGTEVSILSPTLVVTESNDADINDVLIYEFEVSTDSAFIDVVAGTTGVKGLDGAVTWTVDIKLSDNTTYYWRSRSLDNKGGYSEYVLALFFVNTANDAPSSPVMLSPSAGEEILTTLPVLRVNNSTDSDKDSLLYTFELDSVNTYDSPEKQSSSWVVEGTGTTSWTVKAPLVENNTYYWRVKANDGSSESPWMEGGRFFVNLVNEAPTMPVLKAPLDGVAVNTDKPELSLYDASDADGDLITYIYQIANDPLFVSPVAESAPSSKSWLLSDSLDENGYYYWRAKAVDEHGMAGKWSAAGNFMVNIANDPPSAPVIFWQNVSLSENVILDIGNSFDVDGDILSYQVEVYSDRGMTQLVYSESDIAEEQNRTRVDIGKLEKGIYYWRTRSYDGKAYSSWSGVRMLRVNEGFANSNARTDKAYGRKRF